MAGETIESLQIQIEGSSADASKELETLEKTLERLEKTLETLEKTLERLGKIASGTVGGLDSTNKSMKSMSGAAEKVNKSFAKTSLKMGASVLAMVKIGKAISNVINLAADYSENMNLFNVAMGKYADEATEYANTVSDLMGIDVSEWARSQGVFMTLATGFGVVGDRAYLMSKNLTQLGYDISSFYNTSVEEAMQKLKSGFAGELEPLALAA